MPLIPVAKDGRATLIAATKANALPAATSAVLLVASIAYAVDASAQDPSAIASVVGATGGMDPTMLVVAIAIQAIAGIASAVTTWAKARTVRAEELQAQLDTKAAQAAVDAKAAQAALDAKIEKIEALQAELASVRLDLAKAEIRAEVRVAAGGK